MPHNEYALALSGKPEMFINWYQKVVDTTKFEKNIDVDVTIPVIPEVAINLLILNETFFLFHFGFYMKF